MRTIHRVTAAACTTAVLALAGATQVAAAPTAKAPAAKAPAATKAKAAAVPAPADFNGDGYPDLAVGAPNATVTGIKRAGAVSVIYGSATGLRTDRQQITTHATPGIPGEPRHRSNGWGTEAAHGDLDHDGYDDLAITDNGTILVLWGGPAGLSGGTELPAGAGTTASPAIESSSLAIGDVNGDGRQDLVLPAQVRSANAGANWGMAVRYGPFDRATGKPASAVFRDTKARDQVAVSGVRVGDMTGDGIADIVAMGNGATTSGFKALVLKGTRGGLVPGGSIDARHGGRFGDINGDGYQDFVGSPQRFIQKMTGGITVTFGGPDGVSRTLPARFYDQASPGVPGVNEKGDRWGNDVALGDLDRDGYADIVVGASWEGGTGAETAVAGSITVLRGSKTGVTTTGARVLTQNTKGIPDTSEKSDHFGEAVTVLDADRDGRPEVYVGGNGENTWVGRVWQLPTGPGGVIDTNGVTGARSFSMGAGNGSAHFGRWFSH
ncbi:FG-GAP-like repeat-containing protein [Streptomyces sp. NPDC005805]|uniref:FG-GAP-like repeat-containing protein n=1 Tax=Streptomyces sp. NPDC005805 TaxID=3157068 RepID=UPI0033F0C9DE